MLAGEPFLAFYQSIANSLNEGILKNHEDDFC